MSVQSQLLPGTWLLYQKVWFGVINLRGYDTRTMFMSETHLLILSSQWSHGGILGLYPRLRPFFSRCQSYKCSLSGRWNMATMLKQITFANIYLRETVAIIPNTRIKKKNIYNIQLKMTFRNIQVRDGAGIIWERKTAPTDCLTVELILYCLRGGGSATVH